LLVLNLGFEILLEELGPALLAFPVVSSEIQHHHHFQQYVILLM
jgi:hypothetical protein